MNKLAKGAITLSAAGLIALTGYEGYRSLPYQDTGGVWTDGFGNTHNVIPGKAVSVPQALDRLDNNTLLAQNAVKQCLRLPMTQGQYDAFVSFTYNVGSAAFCGSTLVKRFNAGDYKGACDELLRWVYVKGQKVQGLINRREKERAMCLAS